MHKFATQAISIHKLHILRYVTLFYTVVQSDAHCLGQREIGHTFNVMSFLFCKLEGVLQ